MKNDIAKYTIEKSQVECYKIRHPSGMYWADISIDTKPGARSGRIQIASDYGDYQYYWGACGPSFKQFLTKINMDYAAGKFGADHWIDVDKTIKVYKKHVIEQRKSEDLTSEQARNLWDQIESLYDDAPYGNDSHFYAILSQKDDLLDLFSHHPDIYRDVTPQFRTFWNTCWQVFLNQLKEEMKEETETVNL